MKKAFLILVFILCLVKAQLLDIQWSNTFGGNQDDYGKSVVSSETGYISAGVTSSFGNGENDIHIIKTDFSGNEIWSKTYGQQGYDYANQIINTSDNNYVIIGQTNPLVCCTPYNGWLLKINNSGDTLWTKTYDEVNLGYAVIENSDNGFSFVGSAYDTTDSRDVAILMKTDSDGNMIGLASYDFGNNGTNPHSITSRHDSIYYISGEIQNGNESEVFLMKTDSDGVYKWHYNNYLDHQNDDVHSAKLKLLTDGILIYGGTAESPFIIKTDFDGNMIWVKDFNYQSSDRNRINDVIIKENGNILTYGSLKLGDADIKGWVTMLDINGNIVIEDFLLNDPVLNNGYGVKFESAVKTTENNIVITGSTFNWENNHEFLLIKTKRISFPKIAINEIMNNPNTVSDDNGEWFELYNADEDTIDITNWTFIDSGNDSLVLNESNCCLLIPPGEYFLLVSNGDVNTNGGISDYDYVYSRDYFNLGNSDDEIILIDNYGIIDIVEYDGGTTFPDPNGKSMELNYYNNDNNIGSNWVESENLLPSGDYGTPGYNNSTFEPELEAHIDSVCSGGWNNGWMNLGNIVADDSSECILIVTNSGSENLILSNIRITESQNENPNTAFSVRIDSLVISPQETDSIFVYFNPEVAGFYSGGLAFDTNDESEPTHYEAVHGTGLSPVREIYVTTDFEPDTIFYYDVPLGDSGYYEYAYITNIGLTTLEIDDIVVTEPFYTDFSDGSLDMLESFSVQITFIPNAAGTYSGTATIYSNDSDEGEYVVQLYGYTESVVPQTIHVDTTGSDETGDGSDNSPFATIQKGIDSSIDGDTVLVAAGTYVENINYNGKSIVVQGEDRETTIIDGNQNGSVVVFESGEDSSTVFSGFSVTNGTGQLNHNNEWIVGGGIYVKESYPKLSDLHIFGNTAEGASAIYFYNWVYLKNSIINNNSAGSKVISVQRVEASDSQGIIENVLINDNSFSESAITIWECFGGTINLYNSTVANNTSTNGDNFFGGVYCEAGVTINIQNSIIYSNEPSNIGISDNYTTPVTANISYCDIGGGEDEIVYNGNPIINYEDNINVNPLFCDQSSGDYTIAENSPCVGTGENGANIGAFGIGCEAIILSTDLDIIPLQYVLHQNYPNPFNPITSLRYDLPEDGLVNITIYDMMGRIVKTLVNSSQTAGYKSIRWNATNNRNEPVSAGLYLYTIQAGEFRQTKKMVLLK